MPKIIKIEEANDGVHKWIATFDNGIRTKFGDATALDYTQHHSLERRQLYRQRHKKDLDTNDPTRAGYLSYYILWGNSTSLKRNIQEFNRMFG